MLLALQLVLTQACIVFQKFNYIKLLDKPTKPSMHIHLRAVQTHKLCSFKRKDCSTYGGMMSKEVREEARTLVSVNV